MSDPLVKCVAWDLDDTLWTGTLLEDGAVTLRPEMIALVRALDERGVLHSIASRNDPGPALQVLQQHGVAEYFLHPQIHWGPKAESLERIAQALNIGTDALLFVDNDPFERDAATAAVRGVRAAAPEQLAALVAAGDIGGPATGDGRLRRLRYLQDSRRQESERQFPGTASEFQRWLRLKLAIRRAGADDLARAEELTMRTHQLNTTGRAYSVEELDRLRAAGTHEVLVTDCEDRYGSYGTIGLTLLAIDGDCWTIKLLLMSCRVMNRGVGAITLTVLGRLARERGVRLRAELVPRERNRMMHVVLRLSGFRPIGEEGGVRVLELDPAHPIADTTDAEVSCAPVGETAAAISATGVGNG